MVCDYPAISLARHCLVDEPTPGDCHLRRQSDGDDHWLAVVHADPHILIADEVLATVSVAQEAEISHGDIRLTPPVDRPPCEGTACPQVPCWTQWFLHLDGRNRTVVYRIGRWVPELKAWEAVWPD